MCQGVQKQPPGVFFQKAVFENFTIFKEKTSDACNFM